MGTPDSSKTELINNYLSNYLLPHQHNVNRWLNESVVLNFRIEGTNAARVGFYGTASSNRFDTIVRTQLQIANAIILIYDVTKPDSLSYVVDSFGKYSQTDNTPYDVYVIGSMPAQNNPELTPEELDLVNQLTAQSRPYFRCEQGNNAQIRAIFDMIVGRTVARDENQATQMPQRRP